MPPGFSKRTGLGTYGDSPAASAAGAGALEETLAGAAAGAHEAHSEANAKFESKDKREKRQFMPPFIPSSRCYAYPL
jgi:hypothetical protein